MMKYFKDFLFKDNYIRCILKAKYVVGMLAKRTELYGSEEIKDL